MESIQKFILKHANDDVRMLALNADKYKDIDIRYAIIQIKGRQTIKEKIPSWYRNEQIIFPEQLPLEQCSSEATAMYKSSFCKGNSMIDLTGGFGVDCAFLSVNFNQVNYIEQQTELCEIAKKNFNSLGKTHIQVHNENAVNFLKNCNPVDLIYIDPARRSSKGEKVFLMSDCEPNIYSVIDVLKEKSSQILLKLSPMIDLSLAITTIKNVKEAHIVSVGNECKEVLLLAEKDFEGETQIKAVNINKNNLQLFSFSKKEEQESSTRYTQHPLSFLYEPNSSILKAGAFNLIGNRFNLFKLHPNTHLYTSDLFEKEFPGRIFEVKSYTSFSKKELKPFLENIKNANLSVRNFPESVKELHKKLKIKEGGEVYLFACTCQGENRIIVKCKKEIVFH